jgi:hypothetical protein
VIDRLELPSNVKVNISSATRTKCSSTPPAIEGARPHQRSRSDPL